MNKEEQKMIIDTHAHYDDSQFDTDRMSCSEAWQQGESA